MRPRLLQVAGHARFQKIRGDRRNEIHARADAKLAALPVVLVTALSSREHQERGAEVGANAYIVKGSFDQSNLLEVLRSLV